MSRGAGLSTASLADASTLVDSDGRRHWAAAGEISLHNTLTTFGPVTSAVAGLSCVPVTGFTVPCPLLDRPQIVKARSILRMALADCPAYIIGGIGTAGSAELFITSLDEFAPFVVPAFGNNIIEIYATVEARIPANTAASTKQFYIGAHDNTTPPAFFTAKPITLIVAGPHGQPRMTVIPT